MENRFPKYVATTEEDDVIQFLPPPPPQSSKEFISNNMSSTRRSPLGTATNSLLFSPPVIRDYRLFTDKPPLRKSMFSAPQITKQLIRNTSFADIEFSDDDESQMVFPSTSTAARRAPKILNIPIMRPDERARSLAQKPPPPLIEPRTGNILTSSQFPGEYVTTRKPTYADALRQNNPRVLSGKTGHILGTRNISTSSSGGASTTESSRFLNGFSSLRTNQWSNVTRSSILAQEKESEEREKYQQLLEQVVPRIYGSSVENKIPISAQSRRSGLMLAAATSSSRSSPANNRRSLGLSQSILKRPPLSSTINLDDDDEDDITFGGNSHLKQTVKAAKGKSSVPTVIIDDDDISDIIDLDNTDRHVLSQCAKIKQEENSVSTFGADKPTAPKKKAL